MMTLSGWLPLPQAARAAKCSRMQAYDRVYRGEWEAIQGDNGRWLVKESSAVAPRPTRAQARRSARIGDNR